MTAPRTVGSKRPSVARAPSMARRTNPMVWEETLTGTPASWFSRLISLAGRNRLNRDSRQSTNDRAVSRRDGEPPTRTTWMSEPIARNRVSACMAGRHRLAGRRGGGGRPRGGVRRCLRRGRDRGRRGRGRRHGGARRGLRRGGRRPERHRRPQPEERRHAQRRGGHPGPGGGVAPLSSHRGTPNPPTRSSAVLVHRSTLRGLVVRGCGCRYGRSWGPALKRTFEEAVNPVGGPGPCAAGAGCPRTLSELPGGSRLPLTVRPVNRCERGPPGPPHGGGTNHDDETVGQGAGVVRRGDRRRGGGAVGVFEFATRH